MNEITFQKGLESVASPQTTAKPKQAETMQSFAKMLARSLGQVNQLHLDADAAVGEMAAGQQKDIHQTMIAMEKADVAFQLLMQIRNKIVSAYEAIMRMPV